MPATRFSALDLLELPPLDREVYLWVARNGPADAEAVSDGTGHDAGEVGRVVARLVHEGRLRQLADGRVEAALGRISSRTTLPARLWPALLATDRPYTEQEIATLRTAIPILRFARARMTEFTDHGPGHALRVRSFAIQLGYLIGLTDAERHLLRVAALFHDVGNAVDRERHHVISQETVEKLAENGAIPFDRPETEVIGLLCRWHRREYDPSRVDSLRSGSIRTGLLASVLRVADAMDIDHRRADQDESFREVLRLFYPGELPYWTSLEEIAGLRIRAADAVQIHVFTWDDAAGNMQIDMLSRDLRSTPLPWSVLRVPVAGSESPRRPDADPPSPSPATGRALLVFPFDPHALVMASLSRQHLAAANVVVDLLCYPDSPEASSWLWSEALAEPAAGYTRLIVIGDRPHPGLTSQVCQAVRRWRAGDAAVSLLNRHESNWSRLPEVLPLGVEATLGGDWVYFWGDEVSRADLAWARIAALCVRDPTLSTVGVTAEERAVTHGLLRAVFDALAGESPADGDGWRARAEPILDRIAASDRAWFVDQAAGFAATYAAATSAGRVSGRAIVFDRAPGAIPQAVPWLLEAAIEGQGRTEERGIRFNVPYAIATWAEGDAIELVAVSHWREEAAIPIRLLYPDDVGPPPQGNEHALRVRIAADHAPIVVRRLVDACNRS